MTALIIFIFGLILGSFLSVIFSRLEITEESDGKGKKRPKRKETVRDALFGRSRCDHCKKQIPWYDNVPVLSFVLLRGKCRHCGKQISHYHPVLELSAALYLLAAYLYYGLTAQFVVASLFGLIMLLIFAYDLRHQLIPNVIVVPGIVLALIILVYQFSLGFEGSAVQLSLISGDPLSYLIGAGFYAGFFLLLSFLSKGTWIGGGDIKLGLLIGLLLGWPVALVALILSYLIGTVYALILLVTKQATMKSSVPFGPMLVMGYFIALFYGQYIAQWYQGLVL